jgi:hypothetical protein
MRMDRRVSEILRTRPGVFLARQSSNQTHPKGVGGLAHSVLSPTKQAAQMKKIENPTT